MKRLDLEDIEDPQQRTFMEGLFAALKEDFPKGRFVLGLKYRFGYGPRCGDFVRPRYVVKKLGSRLLPFSSTVLEVGDGVLQPAYNAMERRRAFYDQLRGLPPTQPQDLGSVGKWNPRYFAKGSNVAEILPECLSFCSTD